MFGGTRLRTHNFGGGPSYRPNQVRIHYPIFYLKENFILITIYMRLVHSFQTLVHVPLFKKIKNTLLVIWA